MSCDFFFLVHKLFSFFYQQKFFIWKENILSVFRSFSKQRTLTKKLESSLKSFLNFHLLFLPRLRSHQANVVNKLYSNWQKQKKSCCVARVRKGKVNSTKKWMNWGTNYDKDDEGAFVFLFRKFTVKEWKSFFSSFFVSVETLKLAMSPLLRLFVVNNSSLIPPQLHFEREELCITNFFSFLLTKSFCNFI